MQQFIIWNQGFWLLEGPPFETQNILQNVYDIGKPNSGYKISLATLL